MFRVNRLRTNHRWYLLYLALVLVILASYANHFHNAFHFDDWHTIEDNPFIRSLTNIPQFFVDARTFSTLPTNQGYRPVLSTSLALDYWIAGGLNPLYFHITSFVCFVVQLLLMGLLFTKILEFTAPNPHNRLLAFIAVALYGLHPVSAETVNYIIQRGDILSTLGVVASFVLYQRFVHLRIWGLYLLPTVVCALAKPPAVMLAPLLFIYVLLFELNSNLSFWRPTFWKPFGQALWKTLPAFVVCVGLAIFLRRMDSPTFTPGGQSLSAYVLTQPWVWLHYVRSFFLPTELTIDTDWKVLPGLSDIRVWVGIVFVAFLVFFAHWTSRRSDLRPITFGICWFIVTLIPTSVVPLAEVMNDHRMYLPFVGLVMAFVTTLFHLFGRWTARPAVITTLFVVVLLPAYAIGTIHRNDVWRTERSLWLDATYKSPRNGRALMNYGLALLADGEYEAARDYFYRAFEIVPDYPSLAINLGVVETRLGNYTVAEQHHIRSIQLGPILSQPYTFYADFLRTVGRIPEGLAFLDRAIHNVPHDFVPRYLKMEILIHLRDWATFRDTVDAALTLAKNDPKTLAYVQQATAAQQQELAAAQKAVTDRPSPETHLELSFVYYKIARYEDAIQHAQQAIVLKPDYAEAYNNIAAAHAALKRWDNAIVAAQEALRLKPDFPLARGNLEWALREKNRVNR